MLTKNGSYQCDYCGRFIKRDDFYEGKAVIDGQETWNGIDPETYDIDYYSWHVSCKTKAKEREM